MKALFLDRDGVVNIEKNYVHRKEDFELVPGIIDLITDFNKNDYRVFIVTNQAGIARGFYTIAQFTEFTNWMVDFLAKKGAFIEKVYYCPHHPEFSGPCRCRKPEPGMILDAQKDYSIDLSKSILIGDKKSDILAAKHAGVGESILIENHILPKYKDLEIMHSFI